MGVTFLAVSYRCDSCGVPTPAYQDGEPPDGWTKYEGGPFGLVACPKPECAETVRLGSIAAQIQAARGPGDDTY